MFTQKASFLNIRTDILSGVSFDWLTIFLLRDAVIPRINDEERYEEDITGDLNRGLEKKVGGVDCGFGFVSYLCNND